MSRSLPSTERANPHTTGLDVLPTPELIALLVEDQRGAVEAVLRQSAVLAATVDEIARRMRDRGRLHYVGAGSSGRLAALDSAEMPPTFGVSPDLVSVHLAGGTDALVRAVEGAEDDREGGDAAMRDHVTDADAVIGISASGSARFVVAAIARARSIGAYTVALTNASDSALAEAAQCTVLLETGPEALTGSTRLKAGTAQKIALNALSTAIMVRLGRVYGNSMVDVVASNRKLRARAVRLVSEIAGMPDAQARELLARAGGNVKVAVVMAARDVDSQQAASLLQRHNGSLRALL